jgi:hypothetical protein
MEFQENAGIGLQQDTNDSFHILPTSSFIIFLPFDFKLLQRCQINEEQKGKLKNRSNNSFI